MRAGDAAKLKWSFFPVTDARHEVTASLGLVRPADFAKSSISEKACC